MSICISVCRVLYRVTTPGKPGKVREFQSVQGKVTGSEICCLVVFSKSVTMLVLPVVPVNTTQLLYFVSSWCHLVCHFAAVTTPTVK